MFHMFIDLLCKSYQGTRKIMKTKKTNKKKTKKHVCIVSLIYLVIDMRSKIKIKFTNTYNIALCSERLHGVTRGV